MNKFIQGLQAVIRKCYRIMVTLARAIIYRVYVGFWEKDLSRLYCELVDRGDEDWTIIRLKFNGYSIMLYNNVIKVPENNIFCTIAANFSDASDPGCFTGQHNVIVGYVNNRLVITRGRYLDFLKFMIKNYKDTRYVK